MSNKLSELEHKQLDECVTSYFHCLEELQSLYENLEGSMRNGFFEFTVIRREMGSYDAISTSIHIPDYEFHPTNTKIRCSSDPEQQFEVSIESQEPANIPSTSSDAGLRRRKNPEKSAVKNEKVKKQVVEEEDQFLPSKDPIHWFQTSYSTLGNLKNAQTEFQQALKTAIQVANLRIKMEMIRKKYLSILTQ